MLEPTDELVKGEWVFITLDVVDVVDVVEGVNAVKLCSRWWIGDVVEGSLVKSLDKRIK